MALDLEQAAACVIVYTPPAPTVDVVVEAVEVSVDCIQQTVDVQTQQNIVEIVTGGPMGPPGMVSGETLVRPCAETIHGHRAVMIANGAFRRPDLAQAAHADAVIGISEQSGVAGDVISARMRGLISEPSWTWSPGFVYCGTDGVLMQAPSPAGWLLVVGRAVDATTIDVDIDTPFHRAS